MDTAAETQAQTLEAARARVAGEVRIELFGSTQEADNEAQIKALERTFISDTITVPTKEMYAYALLASLGDDVYHEPSTLALEAHVARVAGKDAALFMPSGTMSNQVALRTHLVQPPYTVLCDYRAHINKYEAGGIAFHSGAATTAVKPSNGHHLTLADIEENMILEHDHHVAPTRVIALENTLNGTIHPQSSILAIAQYAKERDVRMHLDGARLWHVAAETGVSMRELCAPFDSVSLCFSKGLGAPIGSCLTGPAPFIAKARWFRKLFGGGMRQTGVLAGCAAYALSYNFPRLPAVHARARRLQRGLEDIGVGIVSPAEACMIFYDPAPIGATLQEVAARAAALPDPLNVGSATSVSNRLVVHVQTSDRAVDDLLAAVRALAAEKRAAGFVPPAREANGHANGVAYRADPYVRKKAPLGYGSV